MLDSRRYEELTAEEIAAWEARIDPVLERPRQEASIDALKLEEVVSAPLDRRFAERGRRYLPDGGWRPLAFESDPHALADPVAELFGEDELAPDVSELGLVVRRLLRELPEIAAIVLRLRFGIGGPPMTQEEVGERLGLTERSIRTLEHNALAQLRGEAIRQGVLEEAA